MGDSERAELADELFALGRGVRAEALTQFAAARVDPQLRYRRAATIVR